MPVLLPISESSLGPYEGHSYFNKIGIQLINMSILFNINPTTVGKTAVLKNVHLGRNRFLDLRNNITLVYEKHFKKSNFSHKMALTLTLEMFCNEVVVRLILKSVPTYCKRQQPQKSAFEIWHNELMCF